MKAGAARGPAARARFSGARNPLQKNIKFALDKLSRRAYTVKQNKAKPQSRSK